MRIARAPFASPSFHLRFPFETFVSREERTLVPRSRASAHRAFQTRCRWRASATSRLRARRRLTDFCNTNRRTGTTPSCRSSPCNRGQDPSCPARAPSPPFESEPAAREVSNRISLRRGVTPSRLLAEDGDAKAERLRAKAASALGARGPLLDSLLVHPLSWPDACAWTETHSPDRATKIHVCTTPREGNRTPVNQGAFHLRRVSFERSESLPLVRPRLAPFYAGACHFRGRCHCKRGTRAFSTPPDAWD